MSVKSITALCFSLAPTQVTQSGMWLPMIPAGLFSGVDGRTWTNSNPDAVVAAFNKKRPFDVEHSTHIKAPQGEPAPAYGWIMRLENREGEIWGLVDWNSEGHELIEEKKYAYYSPSFSFDAQTGQIFALVSAGLTNDPNLDVPALNRKEDTSMKLPKLICEALGISEDATQEDAVVAINSVKSDRDVALNRANTPDLNKFVPKETYDVACNRANTAEAALKAIEQKEHEDLVQSAIDEGKVAPANKDMYVGLCRTEEGRKQFKTFLETAPQIATNSKTNPPPSVQGDSKLEDHEVAMCRKMGIKQEDYLKQKENLSKGE
ncbi:TPA: peptidase [Vibrio harveyi]|nr:peptidase [Vibrio harveyi]HDZ3734294.1 peptidase [Vibrio harveyi]